MKPDNRSRSPGGPRKGAKSVVAIRLRKMRELAEIEASPREELFFVKCFWGVMANKNEIRPIAWEDGVLYLLDQTRLPLEQVTIKVAEYGDAIKAIRDMQVRGAPAIGVTAAYAVNPGSI
ncbi:MAG: hypothetical protein CM1200mP15_20790 [Dehalococcoidia bacterium]|nr:MAG: hypothetical protein CM1200mP15_20790 [Dehalococcoidia bacterium]